MATTRDRRDVVNCGIYVGCTPALKAQLGDLGLSTGHYPG